MLTRVGVGEMRGQPAFPGFNVASRPGAPGEAGETELCGDVGLGHTIMWMVVKHVRIASQAQGRISVIFKWVLRVS